MKAGPEEGQPARVSRRVGTKQAGDIRARWAWVEPAVWTDRMLAALQEGVKGGVWFSLIDKVYSMGSLRASWQRVRSNRGSSGVDSQTVERFARDADQRLARLSQSLKDGSYRPLPVRRVYIPKPGGRRRPLGIPAVADRIVQGSLRNVLEPIFERRFCPHSYGFRPGRGAKDALRRVDGLLKQGYRWVVDADLQSYFDTICHERLMERIKEQVADGRVLSLIEAFLKQGVLEGLRQWTPLQGTPQGAVISPLLANIYLHPLDDLLREAGHEMTRYADDFVILCRSSQEAQRALALVEGWTEQAGLTLHPDKTGIVDMAEPGGFEFLGYHFECGRRLPRKASLQKLKDTIRRKTRRTSGHSLEAIIADVNRTLRGWFEYFKHSHVYVFGRLDAWIRMRLRSILRKRIHLSGRGRGRDHHRWPNAFFAARGLFTMSRAHALACQSHRVH